MMKLKVNDLKTGWMNLCPSYLYNSISKNYTVAHDKHSSKHSIQEYPQINKHTPNVNCSHKLVLFINQVKLDLTNESE